MRLAALILFCLLTAPVEADVFKHHGTTYLGQVHRMTSEWFEFEFDCNGQIKVLELQPDMQINSWSSNPNLIFICSSSTPR